MRSVFAALAAALALGAGLKAAPLTAQGLTAPADVRLILQMTRDNWVAIGSQSGNDLLYFTHLAAWRCGFARATYRLNGATEERVFPMERCYHDESQPNAIRELPYVVYRADSIAYLMVTVYFEDGSFETAKYERREITLH